MIRRFIIALGVIVIALGVLASGQQGSISPGGPAYFAAAGVGSYSNLVGEAADVLAVRNSTNAEELRVYKTWTDASNYERMTIGWNAGLSRYVYGQAYAGTGVERGMVFGDSVGGGAIETWTDGKVTIHTTGLASRWEFPGATGHFLATTNNTYDIGAAGASAPRTVYSATSFIGPLYRSDSAKVLLQGTGTGATQLSATQTTAPTCSASCGTSPSVVGTDTWMKVTMGASGVPASGWVVTFNGTWAAAPVCIVQMAKAGMVVGKQVLTAVTTTTTITNVTNGTAPATTDVYAIHCGGTQ